MYFCRMILKNMKNIIIGCCLFGCISTSATAQKPTFLQGDNLVNFGIGVGGTMYSAYSFTWNHVSRMPAIIASYENCILDKIWDDYSSIGAGGQIAYSSVSGKNSDWRIHNVLIGARGALHYTFIDKLDTYAGVWMGYKFVSGNNDIYHYNNAFAADYFVGVRYYLPNNCFSVFSELGWYVSLFSIGISMKF